MRFRLDHPVNHRKHSGNTHPDGEKDEEEEDHRYVPEPGFGRLHGDNFCNSRFVNSFKRKYMYLSLINGHGLSQSHGDNPITKKMYTSK